MFYILKWNNTTPKHPLLGRFSLDYQKCRLNKMYENTDIIRYIKVVKIIKKDKIRPLLYWSAGI